MWNWGNNNSAYNYCGPTQVSPSYTSCGGSNNVSTFVLIVVLFILLVIVGACYI